MLSDRRAPGSPPTAAYGTGDLGDLLAVFSDEARVRALAPDFTALAPYWSRRLGRDSLIGLQASARTGLVRTAVQGDRVHLTGQAITVLDGILLLPRWVGTSAADHGDLL